MKTATLQSFEALLNSLICKLQKAKSKKQAINHGEIKDNRDKETKTEALAR